MSKDKIAANSGFDRMLTESGAKILERRVRILEITTADPPKVSEAAIANQDEAPGPVENAEELEPETGTSNPEQNPEDAIPPPEILADHDEADKISMFTIGESVDDDPTLEPEPKLEHDQELEPAQEHGQDGSVIKGVRAKEGTNELYLESPDQVYIIPNPNTCTIEFKVDEITNDLRMHVAKK